MTYEKREKINLISDKIRKILNLKTPIDVRKAVEILEGNIIEEKLKDFVDRIIYKDNNSFVIHIDKKCPEERKKFSIAHGIGHLFLHMGFLINQEKWEKEKNLVEDIFYRTDNNEQEKEANEFAYAFLLPKDEFIKIANENLKNGYYYLSEIAEYFKVSIESVRTRGIYLRIFKLD